MIGMILFTRKRQTTPYSIQPSNPVFFASTIFLVSKREFRVNCFLFESEIETGTYASKEEN